VLVNRIYLRNYRVFEDELELDMPPGLVGVYGPNGAGKSTLLESLLWALWGKSRTPKEGIPSAGAHGECIAEVSFEHEGHLYLVRRTISGVNATVKAQAHCDGLAMAEGVRDTGRYVHSVLGMDDGAFRSSVFAEQKQLASFSSQAPAERRRLVLTLLGVTPLDSARDKARADARDASQQHGRLRVMLPDIDEARVTAADAQARADAAEVKAADEERAANVAQEHAKKASEAFADLDLVRQEYDKVLLEGRAARNDLDAATEAVAQLSSELEGLASVEAKLVDLEPLARRAEALDQQVALLQAALHAADDLASLADTEAPAEPDAEALAAAQEVALSAGSALGSARALCAAAREELARAEAALSRAGDLSPGEDCPLCGQPLGKAFSKVQEHRADDVATARERLASTGTALATAEGAWAAATSSLALAKDEVARAQSARAVWEQEEARRSAASARMEKALKALEETGFAVGASPARNDVAATLKALHEHANEELAASRRAVEELARARGRLERRAKASEALAKAEKLQASAASSVEALRAKARSLGYDGATLTAARAALAEADQEARRANAAAVQERLAAVEHKTSAQAANRRLAEALEQHERLVELESSSVHLARTAELLSSFRNTVVASVGPRLAVQAADLFAELTDNEYDRLEVGTEDYDLRISDGGISYDLERFSGSEVDLANLALRVAISEHVRLLSGGTVGLLVLDEIFGPLDEDRKARMLLALERLRGRFRQVIVVTHSTDIKEQLPNAIEVIKRPGRRATARTVEMG